MKRQFKLLACLLVVIAMVFTLASCELIDKLLGKDTHEHSFVDGKCDCGEEDPDYVPHEHEFVDGRCECGEEDPDYVPAGNTIDVVVTDTYVWDDEYTFTATESGAYTFTVPAGLGFSRKDVAEVYGPANVDYYENEEGASFTLNLPADYVLTFLVGSTTRGEYTIQWTFEAAEVDPEACIHAFREDYWNEENVSATCEEEGRKVYICVFCDETKTETLPVDTVNGHDYNVVEGTYVAPTCEEDGYGEYLCSICEDLDERVIDHTVYGSHDYETDEETYVEPTCEEDGYQKLICSVCQDVIEETLYADSAYHDYEYTSNGCVAVCSVCDTVTLEAEIDATETTYGISIYENFMGNPFISIFDYNYDVSLAYAYTYELVDGVYVLTLSDPYENGDELGLLSATATITPVYGGLYIKFVLEDETVLEFNNDSHTEHTFVLGKCECGETTAVEKLDIATLKTGDKVVIGADAYSKLLSMVKTGYYNVGVDYSETNFDNVTNDEIFVVTVNDDDTYSFTSVSGKVLAMAASNNSLNDTGANDDWAITAVSGATNEYYVKNTVRGTYLEWYNSKNNWSTYNSNSDAQFEISFYLVEAAATEA